MNKSKIKWPVVAGAVFIAGFIALMAYTTGGNAKYRCEVCVTFESRTICRNAAAPTQAEAVRTATDNACTDLSSGMTSLMHCQNEAPRKITWRQ